MTPCLSLIHTWSWDCEVPSPSDRAAGSELCVDGRSRVGSPGPFFLSCAKSRLNFPSPRF